MIEVHTLILWGIYFGIHSALASSYLKKKAEALFPSLFPFYRLAFNFISIALLLPLGWGYLSRSHKIISWLYGFPGWGVFLILLGIGVEVLAFRKYSIKEFSGLGSPSLKRVGLNRSGILSYVRHPIYSGIILILIGLLLVFPSSYTLSIFIATLLYLSFGIYFEEKKLTLKYGQEYLSYKKSTHAIIPYIL